MSTIVIMPGGFHPFHAGHAALYDSARRAFPGADVYVAATNDTSNRPFPFAIKEKLAKLAGVEPGHFVQVKSPFQAKEITAKFDPEQDNLIFVRSEKDADKPPQAGGVKKDGTPSYLQPLLGAKKLEPFGKRAYMAYLPTVEFGPGMTSATEIRTAWPQLNEKRKTALVMSLYPKTQSSPALAANIVKMLDAAMGGEEQGVAEGLDEAVGGNYLYHATSSGGLKGMLSSGSIRSATGPQAATSAQTTLPTVSVTRDWGYASGDQAQSQLNGIGRDAILVLDRNAVESNFKTLGTSQSTNIKGLAFNPYLKKDGAARSQNTDPMARTNAKAKAKYAEPTAKAGGEFEEAVVVPKGALPLKGTMVGFWINPKSELIKDPAIMTDPRRLDMVRPNQFVKATQQGLAEAAKKCPPATQDITLNLANRQKAIDEYGYGPLNPDMPNNKFWMAKVDEWNLDSAEEAKQSLCGNCAAFDQRQDTLDCIAQGIDSDNPEDAEGIIDAGELGYCKFLKFKCASRRTCDAWVTGGPLVDKPNMAENNGQMAGTPAPGGMYAAYQARENQPVDEAYVEEKWSKKYKASINCASPKGFSQRAHCAGRKK